MKTKTFILIFSVGCLLTIPAQTHSNRTKKWYFGANAGLDFMPGSPVALANGALIASEGDAAISDDQGNILFYTDGVKVINKNHVSMANGTGLFGSNSTSQAAIIVPLPANGNLYYIFTLDAGGVGNGVGYSIVDMSLAAGMGSVTTKNVILHAPSTEKLTATRHCNGSDVWVVTHDWGSNDFRAFLFTSAGITNTVISSVGTVHSSTVANTNAWAGCMKISPNGKKIAVAISASLSISGFEVYDFDNSTGIVSNPLVLANEFRAYGCEFSPDGTKLYGSTVLSNKILQWDLCAGSNGAIISSKFLIPQTVNGTSKATLQNAPDGKIYCAANQSNFLDIINNPNLPGAACSYSDGILSLSPGGSTFSLPNFITNYFRAPHPAFTFTANCQQVSFTGIAGTGTLINACSATSVSLLNSVWDFGDTGSGTANSSTLINESHLYTAPGSYTAQLILNYTCHSDTLRQIIIVPGLNPVVSVTQPTVVCKGDNVVLSANGPFSYSWSTGSTNASVVVTPSVTPNSQYTVIATNSVTGCSSTRVISIKVNVCPGIKAIEGSHFFFYPNPTTGNLFIETEQEAGISIFNNLGRILVCKKILKPKDEVDLSQFSPGLYFMKVEAGLVSKVVRIIKVE
jgi:PKD repeat protein